MSRVLAIPGLDAARYVRHALHHEPLIWLEKNCYTDIWIELLHALGLDPHAMLAGALALDFVGDQWTFLKPAHAELWQLYGLDVQELTVWRPLLEHAAEHLAAGRLLSTEADAWWLPDTVGTDYRTQHSKSTIIINDLDVNAKRLGYFHNAGYFELQGEDFEQLFRVGAPPDPAFMPLYAEWIHVNARARPTDQAVVEFSAEHLRTAVARMPADNPVTRFAERYLADVPAQHERGLAYYHAWAFANTRQLGASFELAQQYLTWLGRWRADDWAPAIEACQRISSASKTLVLKGARSAMTGRTQGLAEILQGMAADWQQLRAALRGYL